jgi:hypothetical protein
MRARESSRCPCKKKTLFFVKSIWTLRTVSTTAQQDGEAGDVKHSVCIPSHILVLDPFLSIVFKIHLFYYKKVDLILKYMRKCKKKSFHPERDFFPIAKELSPR